MTQNTTDESVSSDHQTKQVPESEMGTLDRLTNESLGWSMSDRAKSAGEVLQ